MSKTIYILFGEDNDCKGVYSSKNKLREGVDYWINIYPNDVLSYQERDMNYPIEPNSWDWAYIPTQSIPYNLARGGGSVPLREYWGKNLIGVKWIPIPGWKEAYK